MVGLPGAGKSFFANKFAETFKAPIVCEETYSNAIDSNEEERVETARDIALSILPEMLKTGSTIIFDGSAGMRSERAEIARIAKLAGYKTLFVWVQTDAATSKQRVLRPRKSDNKQPLSKEAYINLIKRFSQPHPSENYIVLSGKHTYCTQAKTLLKKLVEPRAAASVSEVSAPTQRQQPTGNRIKVV